MKWFGPYSWGAPICEDTERAEIPIGEPCAECGEVVDEHDRGYLIPHMGSLGFEDKPWHFDCMMRNVIGPEWKKVLSEPEPEESSP